MISLFNYIRQVIEKAVAEQLFQYYEDYSNLHPSQMGEQKELSAIYVVTILIHTVLKAWEEKKLAAALFIDITETLDYVSKRQLITRMVELEINGDLVLWTRFFLTVRKVQIVIDGYENMEREIETGISKGSLISPILFLIYISGVFGKVTKTCPLLTSLLFIDDLRFIA